MTYELMSNVRIHDRNPVIEAKVRHTPKHGHQPIRMRRMLDAPDSDRESPRLGDFRWLITKQGRVLQVCIPHDGPSGFIFSQWTIGFKNECGAQWSWDGNEDAPTLRPSLHAVGIWHGWVRDGHLVEA